MTKNKSFILGIPAVLLTFALVLAGCDNGTGGNSNYFVPVTGISCPQTVAITGIGLTLKGTVEPSNATNKTIVWSGTGVSNGVLTASSAGKCTVTATVVNGASESSPYTRTFDIMAYDTGSGDNQFSGKTWNFNVPSWLGGGTAKVVANDTAWTAAVPTYVGSYTVAGTYIPHGKGAEWTITQNPADPTWVGDTGIAILQEGGNLLVSNFENLLMNGIYTPSTE